MLQHLISILIQRMYLFLLVAYSWRVWLNAGETELSQEGATSSRVPSSIPLDSLLPALDKHCTSLSSVLLPSLNWRSAVLGIKSPTVLLRGPKGTQIINSILTHVRLRKGICCSTCIKATWSTPSWSKLLWHSWADWISNWYPGTKTVWKSQWVCSMYSAVKERECVRKDSSVSQHARFATEAQQLTLQNRDLSSPTLSKTAWKNIWLVR
jgi:hypothetical protein